MHTSREIVEVPDTVKSWKVRLSLLHFGPALCAKPVTYIASARAVGRASVERAALSGIHEQFRGGNESLS